MSMTHTHPQREKRQAPKDKHERPRHLGFLEIDNEHTGVFLEEGINTCFCSGNLPVMNLLINSLKRN